MDNTNRIQYLKKQKDDIEKQLTKFVVFGPYLYAALLFGLLIGLFFGFYENSMYSSNDLKSDVYRILSYLAISICASGVMYAYLFAFLRSNKTIRLKKIDFELIELGGYQLQENIEEDFFNRLVKINFNYLDKYYYQTQEQASRSFKLISTAGIIGIVIIISGIFLMSFKITKPGYISSSIGFLVEIIVSVLFVTYNKTIQKMSEYHEKLVLTQNISLALKISENYPEEMKFDLQKSIINELIKDYNSVLTSKKNA